MEWPTPAPSRRRILQEVCTVHKLFDRLAREDGQTMAEYGVVITVITIAALGALSLLSESIMKRVLTAAHFIS